MNRALVNRLADAVLYEGYILYPYRPAVKNRQRWTFGGLYPAAYSRQTAGSEAPANQTEILVRGSDATHVEVVVRFLHLTARQVGAIDPPLTVWPGTGEPPFEPVEALRVGDRLHHTWQEAEECEVAVGAVNIETLLAHPQRRLFAFPGRRWCEPIAEVHRSGDLCHETFPGVLAREQQAIEGVVEVSAAAAGDGLVRLTVTVRNLTPLGTPADRDHALMRTLVSTHVLLGVRDGAFVSLLDPPDDCRGAAAGCRNIGVWPVLVGDPGAHDTVLSSPIILYDYPRVAPESPGDLFDGTEIDEILTLRILTLTDEEKQLAAAVDERVRALLTRTGALGTDALLGLHGVMRGPGPVPGGARG
jgi:hydrogenase maturation protease